MKTCDAIGRRQRVSAAVPPLVFHGTPDDFECFEIFGLGVHFTVDRAVAEKFAGGREGRIVAARLLVRRPLRVPDLATWGVHDVVANTLDRGGLDPRQAAALHASISNATYDDRDLHAALAVHGFDSLVYDNRVEGGGDSYVVFRKEQIRVVARFRPGA